VTSGGHGLGGFVTWSWFRVECDVIDAQLARVAERQHGLVTRKQALRVLSPDRLRRRVRDGRLVRARTGVYRIAGAPVTWEQQMLAAVMVAGVRSVASHWSAAWIWGLAGCRQPTVLEVMTPSRRRVRIPEIKVHDTQVMGRLHVTKHMRMPVTTVARTLWDLTSCCSFRFVERAVDDALRRRLTTLANLRDVYHDLRCRGRRRSTYMRAILEDRLPGFDPGDSDPELKLVRWLVSAGLPKPVQQHRVRVRTRTYKPDLAYPELKIAIEYDGWETHRPRSVFESDRERDNALRLAEWTVLRFTSRSSRRYVVATVAKALSDTTM
jgi:very-short-patch-repair endonuclease